MHSINLIHRYQLSRVAHADTHQKVKMKGSSLQLLMASPALPLPALGFVAEPFMKGKLNRTSCMSCRKPHAGGCI